MVNGSINTNYCNIIEGGNQRRGKNISYTFGHKKQWKATHKHPNHNI